MKRNRIIAIVAGVVMILSLAACGDKNNELINESSEMESDYEQIANPWIEYDSIEEAEQVAGFTMEVPEKIGNYNRSVIMNLNNNEMIEVIYYMEDDDTKEIVIRKGPGSDDISGDYNEYAESNQVQIDEYDVTEKGNDGVVNQAIWTADGYSYSVYASEVTAEEMADIIKQIK